ncbi:poly(ADP-ribose) polymerase catalytic domain-containing protein [Cardiosporidium cionae]|uniref:Poly [ADP-ribose] polymerase n=1 Tax=Cardiosporidium cionae TaxID=476202 RepID=A0ABQ7J9B5_9APIC|nr:poly(ADP-ribose) polymerase catalytic domain-containing protein [Cardiosporidium cionae]|eukprot:KAF8820597.1 poly(ADP-ribose) polymerase catalytic domain-containing protein [Cardiosporidium cionae]
MRLVRFLRRVWSRFHDGFDTLYYHLRCGLTFVKDISEVSGIQSLKWKDIVDLSKRFSVKIDESHSIVQEYKHRNALLWDLIPSLSDIQKTMLFSILDENGYFYKPDRLKPIEAAYLIADGLLFGKLPLCPLCKTQALIQEGMLLRCRGYISSTLHCNFSHYFYSLYTPTLPPINENSDILFSDVERKEEFVLPEAAKRMPFFLKWKLPKDAPSLIFKKGIKFDSEDENLDKTMKGKEFCGMRFSSVRLIDPPKWKLEELICSHGGSYQEDVDGQTTYLLVEEFDTALSTKRYQQALSLGIPILHSAFITAMLEKIIHFPTCKLKDIRLILKDFPTRSDKLPKGIILRQRKYAQFYKWKGKLMEKLHPLKEILEEEKNKEIKRIVISKKRPKIDATSALLKVDASFHRKGGKIYVDEENNAYNCSTVYSDISTGINKFYNLQLVIFTNKSSQSIFILRKWGRMGAEAASTNNEKKENFGKSLSSAKVAFEKLFYEKTGISWDHRFSTAQQPGRYAFVELEGHTQMDEEDHQEEKKKISKISIKKEEITSASKRRKIIAEDLTLKEENSQFLECHLEYSVKELIRLLFDKTMMKRNLEKQHININKMPLGAISNRQLHDGYGILRKIQEMLLSSRGIDSKQKIHLLAVTNQFYNKIPHIFDSSTKVPLIDTLPKLKNKIELMEQLLDVSLAHSIMEEATALSREIHPLDAEYKRLHCNISLLPKTEKIYSLIELMVVNTHASTHTDYTLSVDTIFSLDKEGDASTFEDILPNKHLLWHGSRLNNWVGILSSGLRIAPKEAPTTGYMFDKGLYFADMVSKSANYCFASEDDPTGIVLLCEVSLGKPCMKLEADCDISSKLEGYDSVWGVGLSQPHPDGAVSLTLSEGGPTVAAAGKQYENSANIELAKRIEGAGKEPTLLYNEFIVYKQSQMRIRYLVKLNFHFISSPFDADE